VGARMAYSSAGFAANATLNRHSQKYCNKATSPYFLVSNRNKRGLKLDLKQAPSHATY